MPADNIFTSFISPQRTIAADNETLQVDASLNEEHLSELEMAENPIQFGADVTDHAFLLPLQLTLEAGVSNTPVGNFDLISGTDQTRASSAYDQLKRYQEEVKALRVQTGLKLYESMLLVSLTTAQNVDTERVLIFTAVFRQAIFIDTQSEGVPKDILAGDTQNRRASSVERGRVGTPDVNTVGNGADAIKNRSYLKRIVTFLDS